MKKGASRKKTSRLRKIFTGPSAAIVAAAVGGVFSLSAAVVPRLLPVKQTAQPPAPAPIVYAPIPVPHEPPLREPVWTTPIQLELSVKLPTFPTTAELVVEKPAASPKTVQAVANPPAEKRVPIEFEADKVATSLVQAEAKAPPRTDRHARLPNFHRPNLTYGVWTIFAARDARGNVWNNSTLKITSQRETADGLQIAGFLDWRANGRCAGREYVVGNYVEDTRSLFLQGQRFAGADRRVALSACSARLSEDGRRLIDGTWGSATAHRPATPGRWEARR